MPDVHNITDFILFVSLDQSCPPAHLLVVRLTARWHSLLMRPNAL